jgi:predicted lactoylglutathione lyase
VALRANTRQEVDKFYAEGRNAGAIGSGAPGLRTDYAPNYCAEFLLDADGNNVEAACMR